MLAGDGAGLVWSAGSGAVYSHNKSKFGLTIIRILVSQTCQVTLKRSCFLEKYG